ncbi:MAG: hypothetical protein WCX79_00125 [Candidatus Paceibacterota bacterium]
MGGVGIESSQTIWDYYKGGNKMVLNKLNKLNKKMDLIKKIDGKNFTAVYSSNEKGKLGKMAEEYRESGYLARIVKGKESQSPGWEMLLIRKK